MIDYSALHAVMRQAGDLALSLWPGEGHNLSSWEKAPGNPVSDADLAVNQFLQHELCTLLPEAGWLSEETADSPARLDQQSIWLVDPIDGTRDYIRGRSGWAVSVALIHQGKPLVGVLAAPARSEFWHAIAGQGSWRNGVKLAASARDMLPGARVPATKLESIDADLTPVDRPNSIALRMAMVAADEADIVATLRWGYEWDIGAAALIAGEASAIVTDALGQALHFNQADPRAFGVLTTAPAIHAAAVERLTDRAAALSK